METAVESARDTLKQELLSGVARFNAGNAAPPDFPEIVAMIDKLASLSPVPEPARDLSAVTGSWSSLYAAFGVGHSKGKSHHDESTLSLQTFKAFPDTPIYLSDIIQEIGLEPALYNNVVLFETTSRSCRGVIVIHGTWQPDAEDPRRFRVVFTSAELRGADGADDAAFRRSLGVPDDYALKRDFKPAKLYSDVVYVDETIRINIGGMGGVYVLERRSEPAITL
jgi:hypothetical protein